MGDIAAILILGAKNLTETVKTRQTVEKRRLWGLVKWTEEVEVEQVIDRKAELAKQILEDLSPRALNLLVAQLLQKMELGDFFRAYHFPDRDKPDATDESGDQNDSVWAIVAGTVKAFNLPVEYVLYDMSYANMVMYGATLPSYKHKADDKDGKKRKRQKAIKVDDIRNREKIKSIFEQFD